MTTSAVGSVSVSSSTTTIEDMDFDSLIANLMGGDTEVVEEAVTPAMLDAAMSSIEATEMMMESATVETVSVGAAPTGVACDIVKPKAAKVKVDKAPKVKKIVEVMVGGELAEVVTVEKAPRVVYADKIDRLKGKLGTGLSEYSVLTLADAGVSDEELALKMTETMAIIQAMNVKEQNWAVKFIEYMAGKKASMSEVTRKVLETLEKDGFITTGSDGNVFKTLLAKPYSAGAARAMGGNNIGMLRDLKVITQDGKGKFVANADSLLLMKARSMLFAPVAA